MNANVCISSQRLYRQLLLPYIPECQSSSDFSYMEDNKGQPAGITGHLKGQVQGYRGSESEPLKKKPGSGSYSEHFCFTYYQDLSFTNEW